MSLAKKLSRDFSNATRSRGEDYFWRRLVRIQRGSSNAVEAIVRGGERYQVYMDFVGGTLHAQCDCPHFQGGDLCKHLWATVLAADGQGYLSEAAAAVTLNRDYSRSNRDAGFDEFGDEIPSSWRPAKLVPKPALATLAPPRIPAWRQMLTELSNQRALQSRASEPWPPGKEILYVVDATSSQKAGAPILSFQTRARKATGEWAIPKGLTLRRSQIAALPAPEDREIFTALTGSSLYYGYVYSSDFETLGAPRHLPYALAAVLLPLICRTGRAYLRSKPESEELIPLAWDAGEPWQFRLQMHRADKRFWSVTGFFHRADETMELAVPLLLTKGGLVFTNGSVAPLAADAPFDWIAALRQRGSIQAPDKDRDELLAALLCAPGLPALDVPEELRYEEARVPPRPSLRVRAKDSSPWAGGRLTADLSFDYSGWIVPEHDSTPGLYDAKARTLVRRDAPAEAEAGALLQQVGFRLSNAYSASHALWQVAPKKLPGVVRALLEKGWHIEADGKTFRRPGEFKMAVTSGVDWFELHGEVNYGETSARLPELLEAVRRGDNMVRLGDGTYGMLPDEWMRKIGTVAGMGAAENGHIRFRRSQAGLLDALLMSQPEVTCDATFTAMRKEIAGFHGVTAAPQPAGFVGHLRDYQREGLGWMQFLRRFSFGGCLADDMGVGKTTQVLALLETRREARESGEKLGPSLVVVPRSLVFNWKQEAARFTPGLRVLDYTGVQRDAKGLAGFDLVLTTYGTLRRDAALLKDVNFDYVVLDEAQAIKNAASESAKAARLLRGERRLAMSGTPVENHLGELWSLFEFLNPGLLGSASVFKLAGGALRNPDEETRKLLAHALRPFILRRTKQQVARELPAKTEQTIYCELEPEQRKLYNELREHYRDALLARIEIQGLAKSKIMVLEALLRLRQAACHPGLIDVKRSGDSSAKLDTLLEQVSEVADEGHKALVFSQFTSLLKIVRERLDARGIVYEYLDGQTRDRQARVERFQSDKDCQLFLISLKAGGLGLNLTAAEYVFLLDPWWNPAVEAQAVDRAHRIGQTKQVFAYRLIARDTVEEKVLQLQESKRGLAAAIINADQSLIRDLKREDLELLLS